MVIYFVVPVYAGLCGHSYAVLDHCGVCGKHNSHCNCRIVVIYFVVPVHAGLCGHSHAVLDHCGVCGKHNSLALMCVGTCCLLFVVVALQ